MSLEYSSSCCLYSKIVPTYLHNRPRSFVLHCMERLESAKSIPESYIQEKSRGILEVKSSRKPQSKKYKVILDEKVMPHCECDDWQQNYLPCKHMFAAMVHPPRYPFESICADYRTSPYFTLDEEFLAATQNQEERATDHQEGEVISSSLQEDNLSEDKKEEESNVNPADQCLESSLTDLPLPKKGSHLTIAANCRDMLHQIKGLTYLIANVNVMSTLEDNLETILEELTGSAYKENGFILESKEVRKKRTKKQSQQAAKTSRFPAKLPVEQKRLGKRRSGEGYENWLASRTLNVKQEEEKSSR